MRFYQAGVLGCAASFLALPLVSGCGAFKNAVNDRIDPVENPANLLGKQFPAGVSNRGADMVSLTGTFTGPFADIAPANRQNLLTFAQLSQNLRGELELVPNPLASGDADEALPQQIVLRGLTLTVRLYESASPESAPSREVVIPALESPSDSLVFDRMPATNRYRWNQPGEIGLVSVRVSGDDARRLFALLTGTDAAGMSTNFMSATLSWSVTREAVEGVAGALLFTFGEGEARVGI